MPARKGFRICLRDEQHQVGTVSDRILGHRDIPYSFALRVRTSSRSCCCPRCQGIAMTHLLTWVAHEEFVLRTSLVRVVEGAMDLDQNPWHAGNDEDR